MRALILAALAVPSWAQPEKVAAQGLLDEGAALFDTGDYKAALGKFEEAYRVYPAPRLLFNIGEAHRRLGDAALARSAYEKFLREAGPDTPAELIRLAGQALAEIEAPPEQAAPPAPPPAPPPAASAPAPPPAAVALEQPRADRSPPLYRRWTFWTGVGAVVAGGVVTAVLLANRGDEIPDGDFVVHNDR